MNKYKMMWSYKSFSVLKLGHFSKEVFVQGNLGNIAVILAIIAHDFTLHQYLIEVIKAQNE